MSRQKIQAEIKNLKQKQSDRKMIKVFVLVTDMFESLPAKERKQVVKACADLYL